MFYVQGLLNFKAPMSCKTEFIFDWYVQFPNTIELKWWTIFNLKSYTNHEM